MVMFTVISSIYVGLVPTIAFLFHLLMIVAVDVWKRPLVNSIKFIIILACVPANAQFLVIPLLRGYIDKISNFHSILQVFRSYLSLALYVVLLPLICIMYHRANHIESEAVRTAKTLIMVDIILLTIKVPFDMCYLICYYY